MRDINLKIEENKVTAIIGPSGCGKSTLLMTLNRLIDLIPEARVEGEVLLERKNTFNHEVGLINLRKRVGMVFQKPNPLPKSIYNNVAYGPQIHGTNEKKELDRIVKKSLLEVGLWTEVNDRLRDSAFQLSIGQQQRLCLARTLAIEPEVILMDEPTSALDPVATARIEALVKILGKNYTVIIVTHNMQQAARVSDYTAFLYVGKLIEYGDTKTIFEKPKDQLTENYITGKFG